MLSTRVLLYQNVHNGCDYTKLQAMNEKRGKFPDMQGFPELTFD